MERILNVFLLCDCFVCSYRHLKSYFKWCSLHSSPSEILAFWVTLIKIIFYYSSIGIIVATLVKTLCSTSFVWWCMCVGVPDSIGTIWFHFLFRKWPSLMPLCTLFVSVRDGNMFRAHNMFTLAVTFLRQSGQMARQLLFPVSLRGDLCTSGVRSKLLLPLTSARIHTKVWTQKGSSGDSKRKKKGGLKLKWIYSLSCVCLILFLEDAYTVTTEYKQQMVQFINSQHSALVLFFEYKYCSLQV